ncbi:carbohydrate ABC transporter permease [Salinibacterium soli]|uniref:Sugar ABC transporter permease n=1 Tax=Antiquaquibacter soli TaxID=3064523 RepID=A0ABT9BUQ1_9MICO|nr:sugar ABC transporter permease [Protaetiibacter sp. WY-16]MDO7883077.1 sugar ABC transporter permease [Protaetiibacter sp. WY-16]
MTATTRSVPGSKASQRSKRSKREARIGMLLVLPAALMLLIFFAVPLVQMIWMSLFDWPLLGQQTWVGIQNYITMFQDSSFVRSLAFSGAYTLVLVPVLLVLGMALALLVRPKRRGVGAFRTIFFAPVVIGFSSAAYIWIYLLNPRVGLFDELLQTLGLTQEPVYWFASPNLALLSVVVMVVWKSVGFGMLLLLTGLLAIPDELTDAARIDRAGRFQTFRYVTLPLLRRPIALTLVFSAVGSVLAFEQFYLLTGGGPEGSTTTVVMEIFRVGFNNFQLGLASAMSIFLMVILVVISAVQLVLLRDQSSLND